MTFPRLMLTQSRASRYGRKVSTMRRSSAGVFVAATRRGRELSPRQHGVPQANAASPEGGSISTGEEALPSAKKSVGHRSRLHR